MVFFGLKHVLIVRVCCFEIFLSTTYDLSVYHQWYACHRLGTPDDYN